MPPFVIRDPNVLKSCEGKELGVSGWRPVTQEQIQQFANATGDHQWIHLDAERAKRESPYGTTIAHGFLTLSLISSLMGDAMDIRGARMVVNYGLNRVRFPAPVRVNSRMRGRFGLVTANERPGAIHAIFSVTVEIENESKPGCVAEWVVRYYL